MKHWPSKLWKENKSFILFVFLMLVFRSAVADWSDVPTGSMKPTIVEGDRILVNKLAYDLRVPFTHISLFKIAEPERGEIIVFDSDVSEKRLVKRVVGIPGDVISMIDNELFINGEKLNYRKLSSNAVETIYAENLLGIEHMVRIETPRSVLSNFGSVRVPENMFLALGDNRDNSADSRVIGFVPRKEIVGRTSSVAFSLDYDNYFIPRSDRFFQPL